jgi:hypothetical protein
VSSIQSRNGKRQPIVDNPSTDRRWLAIEQLNVVTAGGDGERLMTQPQSCD